MLKKIGLVVLVGLLMVSIIACTANNEEVKRSPEDIVATVNGKEILRGDLDKVADNLKSNYLQYGIDFESEEGKELLVLIEEEALYNLIQEELLLQSALEKNYGFTEEEVEYEIDQIRAQFDSEEEFLLELEASKFTLEELETMIAKNIIISQYIHDEIGEAAVSDDEVKAKYDEYSEVMEDMPEFEVVKYQLEEEIKYEKYMVSLGELIEKLMDESEIEILL